MKKNLSWIGTLGLFMALPQPAEAAQANPALAPVQHIIVIVLENHSFDNLFGNFPGAEGLDKAGAAAAQTDRKGKAFTALPRVMETDKYPSEPDARFPELPNRPFAIDQYVPANE